MKQFILIINLFLFASILAGCAQQVREVETVDQVTLQADQNRYYELNDYFESNYSLASSSNAATDEYYTEYISLKEIFDNPWQGGEIDSDYALIQATVDLNSQTIHYNNQLINYESANEDYQFSDSDINPNILRSFLAAAQSDYDEDFNYNQSFLLRTAWLPAILLIIGIVSIIKPNWIWFVEDGYKFKNSKPSNFILNLNTLRGLLAIGIAVGLSFLIWRGLR